MPTHEEIKKAILEKTGESLEVSKLGVPPSAFWSKEIFVKGKTVYYRFFSPQSKGDKQHIGYYLVTEIDQLKSQLSHYDNVLKYIDHYRSRYNEENVRVIVAELKQQLLTAQ
jgi:hypothetical protein